MVVPDPRSAGARLGIADRRNALALPILATPSLVGPSFFDQVVGSWANDPCDPTATDLSANAGSRDHDPAVNASANLEDCRIEAVLDPGDAEFRSKGGNSLDRMGRTYRVELRSVPELRRSGSGEFAAPVTGTPGAPGGIMKWLAIALFVISYGFIVLLPMWRRRQAAASRETPGGVAPPIGADELKRRLQALALDHPEIDVTVAGEMVQVSWNLDPERLRSHPDELGAKPTYRLELQIVDRNVVNVRYAEGVIHWESLEEDPSRLEPSIVWSWPLEGIGGGEVDSSQAKAGHKGPDMQRSVGHLVRLVRDRVFEAGYDWQPVLEMVPTAAPAHVAQVAAQALPAGRDRQGPDQPGRALGSR